MAGGWPKSGRFALRYRVDDLIAEGPLRAVFIGESPHRDEVAPESARERSPFRGVAGREWWTELARFARDAGPMRPVPPRGRLLELVNELGIAVMNAVQYPIDPKIMLHQGPDSAPSAQLGFEKSAGPKGYKAVLKAAGKGNPVDRAIADLAGRLKRLADAPARVVCLGNDSRWFVERALERLEPGARLLSAPPVTIPHPSSWWRNASYRARAVSCLEELLVPAASARGAALRA